MNRFGKSIIASVMLGGVCTAAFGLEHRPPRVRPAATAFSRAATESALPSAPAVTTTTTTSVTVRDRPAVATTTTTSVKPPAVARHRATEAPSTSLLRAEAVVRSMHYTPVANIWYPDSVPGPLLEAIDAVPEGTVVGNQGHRVFFFFSGNFVGTDTSDGSANLVFAFATGLVVAVNYDLYHRSDPLCCPSAGAKTVRFQWDGSRLRVLDAIPSPDPGADPTRN